MLTSSIKKQQRFSHQHGSNSVVATVQVAGPSKGFINGVRLKANIELMGGFRYAFRAKPRGANLSGTKNPVQGSLGIGDNAGLTSVEAHLDRNHEN
jgi:hypothetical protein